MEIIKAMSAVMEAVGGVSKKERNQHQGFNFRGIDAVVNAVSPALRANNVVVVPRVLDSIYETVTVGKNQTQQGHARVTVEYTFYASDGSSVSATVAAESMDSGDKATAKAMSVAFRTALLQALCLPTDESDPDADSYERSPRVEPTRPKQPEPTVQTKEVKATKSKPNVHENISNVALTKAQQTWVTKQVAEKFAGELPLVVIGDILKREINSLNDVTLDEVRVLIPALAGK
jgi:hypothetical protein